MIFLSIFAVIGILYSFFVLAFLDKIEKPTKSQTRRKIRSAIFIFVCFGLIGLSAKRTPFEFGNSETNAIIVREVKPHENKVAVKKICDYCKKDITYDRDFITFFDSTYKCKECLDKSVKKFEDENAEKKKIEEQNADPYDGTLCKNCTLGRYRNGFCYSCGAASPYKVMEHQQRLPNCSFCHGTGIEKTGFGEQRVCPVCDGSGKSGS